MPTGIRQPIHLNSIVAAMQAVEANWLALSAQQRCEQIAASVRAALIACFVPAPTLTVANLGGGLNGQFDFGPWTLRINSNMANQIGAQTAKEVIARLGDVITHEARHCEQWWRMLRLIVGDMRAKGLQPSASALGGKFQGVSTTIVGQAVGAPPLALPEVPETRAWYESVYGSQSSFRDINVYGRNLRPTGGQFANVGAQFQASEFARYQRGLAEEEDAHQTGRAIQQLFLQGSGLLPQTLVGHKPIAQGIAQY
ncbi:MAG TPA: hypothetical protein VN699_09200 [Pirellulales bacterium]|nr:hypothetical protein [Pirellulales bacterium]